MPFQHRRTRRRMVKGILLLFALGWWGGPGSTADVLAQSNESPAGRTGRGLRRNAASADLTRRSWEIAGVQREALLHLPEKAAADPVPVLFAFHGHGGSMQGAAAMFHLEKHWPEAIVVYMQGLNTPGRLTDPEGKRPGWQSDAGVQEDRDLKFFDAVLDSLKKEHLVDERRIYATGHSNGGAFTYLLWQTRGDLFAAVAPSAAAARGFNSGAFHPKPVMHLAGEKDELVKFEWQQATMAAVRSLNGCVAKGKTWAPDCLIYDSPGGTPVVTLIHSGGHGFSVAAPPLIVRFFKEYPRP